jgi:predicted DNA-binding transcriptional regulator AlpA
MPDTRRIGVVDVAKRLGMSDKSLYRLNSSV